MAYVNRARVLCPHFLRYSSKILQQKPTHYQRCLAVIHPSSIHASNLVQKSHFSSSVKLCMAEALPQTPQTTGRNSNESDIWYRQMFQKIGNFSNKQVLLKMYEEIIHREGKVDSLAAYQVLKNCGKEMYKETPETRVQLANELWESMKGKGFKFETGHYNVLLSVYLQNDHHYSPIAFVENMQMENVEPNKTTMSLLVQSFCQSGDISGALKVLEFMKAQKMPISEDIYSYILTGYSKCGEMNNAVSVFDTMISNGLKPGRVTYSALLKAYASKGDCEQVYQTLNDMEENNVYPNYSTFLGIIDSLIENSHFNEVLKVLEYSLKNNQIKLIEEDFIHLAKQLLSVGQMNLAIEFGSMIKCYDVRLETHGVEKLLIRIAVECEWPLEKVSEMIQAMISTFDSHLEDAHVKEMRLYRTALGMYLEALMPDDALAAIRVLVQKDQPVKQHFFYPVLKAYQKGERMEDYNNVMAFMKSVITVDEHDLQMSLSERQLDKDLEDVDIQVTLNMAKKQEDLLTLEDSVTLMRKFQKTLEFDLFLDYLHLSQPVLINSMHYQINDFIIRCLSSSKVNVDESKLMDILMHLRRHMDNKQPFNKSIPRIITKIIKNKGEKAACNFVYTLWDKGLKDMAPTVTAPILRSLNAVGNFEEFTKFIKFMKSASLQFDEIVYLQILKAAMMNGNTEVAEFCMSKLEAAPDMDDPAYAYLINTYHNQNVVTELHHRKVIRAYEEMTMKGLEIASQITLGNVVTSYTQMQDYHFVVELEKKYQDLIMKEFENRRRKPLKLYSNFIRARCLIGDVEGAKEAMELKKKLCGALRGNDFQCLIQAYLDKENIEGILECLDQYSKENLEEINSTDLMTISLGTLTKTALLCSLKGNKEGVDLVFSLSKDQRYAYFGTEDFKTIFNVMDHLWHGDVEAAKQLIKENPKILKRTTTLSFFLYRSSEFGKYDAIENFFEIYDKEPSADMYLALFIAYHKAKKPELVVSKWNSLYDKLHKSKHVALNVNKILKKYGMSIPLPEKSEGGIDAESIDLSHVDDIEAVIDNEPSEEIFSDTSNTIDSQPDEMLQDTAPVITDPSEEIQDTTVAETATETASETVIETASDTVIETVTDSQQDSH